MGQPNEPSMEEILSSIKRIIAEDSDAPIARRPRPAPAADPFDEPEVLELTETVGEPEVMESVPTLVEQDLEPQTISAEEAPALAPAPSTPSQADIEASALLSAANTDATRAALAALSRMVVKPEDPAADNTLEGLVREMLRPMLKDWLDANLPRIVQTTVDREVARISGRGA